MAGASLLALLDDITAMLDDVAAMTKLTTQKTAGVLGDDLALNAQQVSGVRADRELPVVWAVAKGSMLNKAILVPAAMLISFFIPWAIIPLLMIGGAYLCYEGFEKVSHKFFGHAEEDSAHRDELKNALLDASVDLVALEKEKIKGAIRTDMVLSAEIMAIALGMVAASTLMMQFLVLTTVAILVTVVVYGLVAAIVRMDDVGLYLTKKNSPIAKRIGLWILVAAPALMKVLTIVGTVAMFLVGGGILLHGSPYLTNLIHDLEHAAAALPYVGSTLDVVVPIAAEGIFGVIAGAIVLMVVNQLTKFRGWLQENPQ